MLAPWDRRNLLMSGFDPKLETKIIIPGWLDNIKRTLWFKRMKDAFQYYWRPVNVIVVYWKNFTPYTIATANTRVVGAELANLIKFLERECGYDRSYYHIIGHSLGAHIGGYAGDRLPGLGRITALDPARPFFQHMPKSVRLDRGDAKFVDAIHSDFTPENAIFLLMSFGMTTPVGHVDFYPNGPPLLQAGCLRDTLMSVRNGILRGLQHNSLSIAFLEAVRYLTACDHQRSHEWFTESILNRQCVFVGVRCNEFEGMINGRCTCDDSPSACAIMGIHADQMFMHGVHDDPWPLRGSNLGSSTMAAAARPLARPVVPGGRDRYFNRRQKSNSLMRYKRMFEEGSGEMNEQRQVVDPVLDENDVYAHLKYQRQSTDQITANQVPILPIPQEQYYYYTDDIGDDHDDNNFSPFSKLDEMQDKLFLEYLKSNLFEPQNKASLPRPFAGGNSDVGRYNEPSGGDFDPLRPDSSELIVTEQQPSQFDFLFHQQAQYPFNQHPTLMSDVDRDFEDWYENSSRWYLKTNNRPDYCVNQYQLLVYLGPLKSSNRKEKLRANLLISIIGSRGQLVNQRFVPRGSQLDSFTMQPFFILLEGSYSLGNILSVAIGWEARYDPDPIQATVSFESNMLSNLESVLPSYKAKHPWLSETLKYDHSRGFRWNQHHQHLPPIAHSTINSQATGGSLTGNLLSNIGIELDRRSGGGRLQNHLTDLVHELDIAATSENSDCKLESKFSGNNDGQCSAKPQRRSDDLLTMDMSDLGFEEANIDALAEDELNPVSSSLSIDQQPQLVRYIQSVHHPHPLTQLHQLQMPLEQPSLQQQITEPLHTSGRIGNHITAVLHNINLHEDPDIEDSIVINEVVISPLQANYGKFGSKTSRTFCPPHRGFHLRRDQTVRLVANLIGKCNQVVDNFAHSFQYNPPHPPRTRPQPIHRPIQPQAFRA